jgi:hypothetical protein
VGDGENIGSLGQFTATPAGTHQDHPGFVTDRNGEPLPMVRRGQNYWRGGDMNLDSPTRDDQEVLTAMYQEVCRSHSGIAEFRGRLLGLLPLASGAGIGILIANGESPKLQDTPALIVIGLLGAFVTFGLYVYDGWQTDSCRHLLHHAAWLEGKLGVKAGQFGGLRPKLRLRDLYIGEPFGRKRENQLKDLESQGGEQLSKAPPSGRVGAELAGFVIYNAVILAWLVVAIVGVVG